LRRLVVDTFDDHPASSLESLPPKSHCGVSRNPTFKVSQFEINKPRAQWSQFFFNGIRPVEPLPEELYTYDLKDIHNRKAIDAKWRVLKPIHFKCELQE